MPKHEARPLPVLLGQSQQRPMQEWRHPLLQLLQIQDTLATNLQVLQEVVACSKVPEHDRSKFKSFNFLRVYGFRLSSTSVFINSRNKKLQLQHALFAGGVKDTLFK